MTLVRFYSPERVKLSCPPDNASRRAYRARGLPYERGSVVNVKFLQASDLQSPSLKWWELSTADQIAPRMTIRIVLCFPFSSEASTAPAIEQLKKAVKRTLAIYPFLTGDLVISKSNEKNGRVNVVTKTNLSCSEALDKVFHVKHFPAATFAKYSDLKAARFPAEALCTREIAPPSSMDTIAIGAPVFLVQANFITGGILLSVYLNHAICDGACMERILETLANGTSPVCPEINTTGAANAQLVTKEFENIIPTAKDITTRVEQLFQKTSSGCVLLQPAYGPWSNRRPSFRQIENTIDTCTFIFEDAMLANLAATINERHKNEIQVSKNDCVGALIWIHTVAARLPEHQNLPNSNQSRLLIPVNYRKRVRPAISDAYFGNAVACPIASIDVKTLTEAASESVTGKAVEATGAVARAIKSAVNSVNTTNVRDVLELGKYIPDVRNLGVNFCCEDSLDVQFNTWAALGAETQWTIPGVPGENAYPEFVRKGHEFVRHGGNLVLPRRRDAPEWEVVIALEDSAMHRLKQSKAFAGCLSAILT